MLGSKAAKNAAPASKFLENALPAADREPVLPRLLYSTAMRPSPRPGSRVNAGHSPLARASGDRASGDRDSGDRDSGGRGIGDRALTAVGLGAIGLGIFGCNLDSNFSDLGEKLLDPDVQGLDIPGQRMLAGPHFDLSIQANEVGARYALARSAESELAIIDFAEETHCRTDEIVRYDNSIIASGQPALIPLLLNEGGATRLGFTNFACERSPFELDTNRLPLRTVEGLSVGSGTALLIETPSQGLALVDPWAQTSRDVAESVPGEVVTAFGHFLWVDRGVIVVSDPALKPLAYYGQGVSQFSISPEDAELAYVEAEGDGAGGQLYVVNAASQDTPRQVASDACSVRYLTVGNRRQLAYMSPCAERRLLFQDLADASIRVISANVADGPAIRTMAGESIMTYVTTESSDTANGTLWLVRGDADAVAIAENARVRPSAVSPGGGLLAVLDWGNTGGRLVEWKDDAIRDVAEGVIELGSLGVLEDNALTFLGNFNGTTGDLMRLNADLSTDVLASGVPQRAANEDAFLANFDGTTGDLLLLDRKSGAAEVLSTGVARGSFGHAQQFHGIIVLSDRDAETNTSTLRLRLLGSGREYEVSSGVTETREVSFPSPGLLYNVVIGEGAGVWFSKAL